ncbi:hypothetical protein RSOLAG22IIIB_09295 [Rhizoctonia solani]|uniref:Uncharacterized protein n=1 Tax=Rhizoctonia solani TaxID=456999 RepID=A0A0K6FY21_9AGAM|nr:hypothetical protein RSOLAG22IIIB_09295 [Rhizoctonia solani]
MNENTWSINAITPHPEFPPVVQIDANPASEPTNIQPTLTNVSHFVDPASIPLPSSDDDLFNEWLKLLNEEQLHDVSTLTTSNLDEISTVNVGGLMMFVFIHDNVHSNQQTTQLDDDTPSIGSGQLDSDDLASSSSIVPRLEIDATDFTPYSETIPGWEEYHKAIDEGFIGTNGSALPQSHPQCDTSTSPSAAPALPSTVNPTHTSTSAPIPITSNLAPTAPVFSQSQYFKATQTKSNGTNMPQPTTGQLTPSTECLVPGQSTAVQPYLSTKTGSSSPELRFPMHQNVQAQETRLLEQSSHTRALPSYGAGNPFGRGWVVPGVAGELYYVEMQGNRPVLVYPTEFASSTGLPITAPNDHSPDNSKSYTRATPAGLIHKLVPDQPVLAPTHDAQQDLAYQASPDPQPQNDQHRENIQEYMHQTAPGSVQRSYSASALRARLQAPEGLYIPSPPPVTSLKPRGNETFDLAYWQGATLDPGPLYSSSAGTFIHTPIDRYSHGHSPAIVSSTGAHNPGPSLAPENRDRKRRIPSEVDDNDGFAMILESNSKGKHARHRDN